MLTYQFVSSFLQQRERLPFSRTKFNGGNWEAKMNLLAPVSNLHLLYFHGAKVTITISSENRVKIISILIAPHIKRKIKPWLSNIDRFYNINVNF